MTSSRTFASALLAATFVLAACSSAAGPTLAPVHAGDALVTDVSSGKYIKHVVILIQENRSFDNLFATFPGADGATSGKNSQGKTVPLKKVSLAGALDVNHSYKAFLAAYDNGAMDGFNLEGIDGNNPAGTYPYQYVDPSQLDPYWTLATQYALADHLFATQASGSFTAHQDLIAGATAIDSKHSVIDYPSNFSDWGCDAPPSTTTSLIDTQLNYLANQGPPPCFSYATMRDLLDAHHVSWRYYTPIYSQLGVGKLWNAFAAIDAVRHDPAEWNPPTGSGDVWPETTIFDDITAGTLPAVSWVIPNSDNSDHPWGKNSHDTGPSWVAQVVNAIGTSSYWNSTAVIILWDDWGGFYDHVPPPLPRDTQGGLGFRVPMIVVSPYVPAGTIAKTHYEFGSILKFVEGAFKLGSLGTTDARSTSIFNIFKFKQAPRSFHKVKAKYSLDFFRHQPPSNVPVDTQ